MPINLITAMEIFTNPGDLEFTIGQERDGPKFAIGIFRGPGHDYKPMLTSQPFAETREEAVNKIQGILQTVHETLVRELADPKSSASQFLNPDRQKIDETKILNPGLIEQILGELRRHGKASTCNMLVAAG